MKRRTGFTLAEVIIVLGIVGIVAEMTIPSVLSDFQEKTALTQFQKSYTELSQAYISAAQENGTINNWATDQDMYNYMKPYLKIMEDCPKTTGCFPKVTYNGIKGTTVGLYFYNPSTYKLRLANGASILFKPSYEPMGTVYIDINGDKAPNAFGKDMFVFMLATKSGAPYITGYNLAWAGVNYCSLTLDSSGWIDGGTCSNWIIKNKNMDYLHRNLSAAEFNQ